MAEKKYFIAIDSGTQSVRAVLFDKQGTELDIVQAKHEPYFSLKPGWTEQHTEDYWNKACFCTRGLMEKIDIDPQEIAGVGITTQRNTVFPVDENGTPLRAGIIWLDQREVEDPPPMTRKSRAIAKAAGMENTLRSVQKKCKINWIRINEPEIYAKTYKFMQVSGWLGLKLTGEFKDSIGMQVGYWPFDFKHLKWHSLDLAYEALGMERKHCVDLTEPDETIGHITAEAAAESGLPVGLPVIIGGGDKQSELLGAGAITPNIGVISYGTATAMEILTHKYVAEKNMRFYTFPASIPGAWDLEMFIFRGFWMVTWFKQEFAHREAQEAAERGVVPEVILDEVIRDIPPGSMGLMLQPSWSPLEDDKYAKGSIIGFGDVHTRAHIYRAILEGLGYELRRLYDIVYKKTGVPLKEIRVGGGGSKSDTTVQIAADMFNLPVSRMSTSEISALGVAINVAVGTGIYADYKEATDAMVHMGQTFTPNPESHKIYDELYHEVYRKNFSALKPLNKKIAKITGYPPED